MSPTSAPSVPAFPVVTSISIDHEEVTTTANKNIKDSSIRLSNTPKPKKPLSAYNLFFQLERQRILEGGTDHIQLPITVQHLRHVSQSHQLKQRTRRSRECSSPPPLPQQHQQHRKSVSLSSSSFSSSSLLHLHHSANNKNSGPKLSFQELAQIVADRWKELDEDTRTIMQKHAEVEKRKYAQQLEAWEEEQKQRLPPRRKRRSKDTSNRHDEENNLLDPRSNHSATSSIGDVGLASVSNHSARSFNDLFHEPTSTNNMVTPSSLNGDFIWCTSAASYSHEHGEEQQHSNQDVPEQGEEVLDHEDIPNGMSFASMIAADRQQQQQGCSNCSLTALALGGGSSHHTCDDHEPRPSSVFPTTEALFFESKEPPKQLHSASVSSSSSPPSCGMLRFASMLFPNNNNTSHPGWSAGSSGTLLSPTFSADNLQAFLSYYVTNDVQQPHGGLINQASSSSSNQARQRHHFRSSSSPSLVNAAASYYGSSIHDLLRSSLMDGDVHDMDNFYPDGQQI
ncbi:hypothetical protein ACA910_001949 [Epithemia clementina (nom. ined.)]